MENTSDLVYQGKLLHETVYPRRSSRYKEIEFPGIKIDFYDPIKKIVHEIKKTDKNKEAHQWQLKYYIYILEQNGINDVSGILEYPKEHKTEEVLLSKPDKETIIEMLSEINFIIHNNQCPKRKLKSKCKNCSYFDFCWSDEKEGNE